MLKSSSRLLPFINRLVLGVCFSVALVLDDLLNEYEIRGDALLREMQRQHQLPCRVRKKRCLFGSLPVGRFFSSVGWIGEDPDVPRYRKHERTLVPSTRRDAIRPGLIFFNARYARPSFLVVLLSVKDRLFRRERNLACLNDQIYHRRLRSRAIPSNDRLPAV